MCNVKNKTRFFVFESTICMFAETGSKRTNDENRGIWSSPGKTVFPLVLSAKAITVIGLTLRCLPLSD